jgi:ketosteroid isomerase-like protein
VAEKKSIESVLEHHVQALVSRDLDNIVTDYADDAVMLSPNVVFKGPKAIRACFSGVLGILNPEEFKSMKVIRQDVCGDYVYIIWSTPSIPLGSDTLCIRDGKIVMQSFISANP